MKLEQFKCINENVSLEDYYKLYEYVRSNMEVPEWLGLIPKEDTINILNNGGKIWLYYDSNNLVCSMFYIPSNNKTLRKHNIEEDETITGSLGPIMVSKDYVGNGLMIQMLNIFDEYNKSIGNKYIFTKIAKDNIFSKNNLEKNNYISTDEYENERGLNLSYLKKL